MTVLQPHLAAEVGVDESFNAEACMNCGICSAICPMDIPHLPRELFRYVELGMRDEVLAHQETVFSCLLCKLCDVNCPAGVHIADNVCSLRHYFNRSVFRI